MNKPNIRRTTLALAKVAQRIENLLLDASRCELVVVSLPEELPINETIELVRRSAEIGLASRTVVVRLHMTDTTDVLPGMFGRLRIPMESEQVLALPASAVIRAGQLTMIDVVRGTRLERRTVQLGRPIGDGFEVLSGLATGETVVLRGSAEAPQGRAVR
jgi:multidrug efflux pump subunit AcrA (membrane-fusion protein)